MVKKVSLFIVGQPKSGTTALAQQLSQHPDICMSEPKEPHYFATDLKNESDRFHGHPRDFLIRTLDQYEGKLFTHRKGERILGEASTGYLFSKVAAKNIYAYNPNAKIIISLREPVSLLHSLHMQYVNESTENEEDFVAALEKESSRMNGIDLPSNVRAPSYLYYSQRIKYAEQINRYMEIFPNNNVYIFTAEEYRKDNAKIYHEIIKFLGLGIDFEPSFKPVHESKQVRLKTLNIYLHNPALKTILFKAVGPRLYTSIHKNIVDKILMKKAQRPALNNQLQKKLREQYRPEVLATSKLIHRDLLEEWEYS